MEHRKAYHEFGNLPFSKLMDRLQKQMRVLIQEHADIMHAKLSSDLRELQDKVRIIEEDSSSRIETRIHTPEVKALRLSVEGYQDAVQKLINELRLHFPDFRL